MLLTSVARAGDVGQVGDVARLAGTHLVDGIVGIFRCIDHRQRQADLVVAVARIGVDHLVRVLGHLLQDRQQQALHAGLAVAAGDREHLGATVTLHAGGDPGQCQFAVGHQHLRQFDRQQALDQQRTGTARLRVGREVMAVETLTAQRDVQATGAQVAGVIADRIDGHVVAVDLAAGPVCDQRKQGALHAAPPRPVPLEHRPWPPVRPRPLRCRRSHGARHSLPGTARGPCRDQDDVAGTGALHRQADRARALRCTVTASAFWKPARMSATITSPSSPRGLSSVTMTWLARRSAIAAICGRLPVSRSPPQPNTQNSAPCRWPCSCPAPAPARPGYVRSRPPRSAGRSRRRGGSCGHGSAAAPTPLRRYAAAAAPARAGTGHGQQVVHVEAAQQRRLHRSALAVDDQFERRCHDRQAAAPRRARWRPRHHASSARSAARWPAGREQLAAEGIVRLITAAFRPGRSEQPRLGRAVAGHVAVVIQMVAGEVGEHRHVVVHGVTRLVERMRAASIATARAPASRSWASNACICSTSGVVKPVGSTAP